MKYPLNMAKGIAEEICEDAKEFCEAIEVAGSIRRQKEWVKDIEIIAIPKWHEEIEQLGLFETKTVKTNLLFERMKDHDFIRWIKPGTDEIIDWHIDPDGRYWRGIFSFGLKLDFFLARKTNFGIIKLIRTGSNLFSKAVMIRVRRKGFRVKDGHIYKDDARIETPDEQSVFDLLELKFIEPKDRIDGSHLQRKVKHG